MQGIVIAGTHSGSGKTTITLGILAALRKKGYRVQPFKTGPDFIDPGLHKLVTGRTSRNLDLWMCGSDYVKECFQEHAADADISVVEGVMGMYDGSLSTADLAAELDLPVVLVVDAYGMAESAGAIVKGFLDFRGNTTRIAGVIFNRIASERHYKRVKDSVQDVPVLGYLPRSIAFNIPDRHLGLVVAEENPIDREEIDKLADAIIAHVDIEAMLQNTEHRTQNTDKKNRTAVSDKNGSIKIGVAYDKAFCFYYEDNLDMLREAGAEIVYFSPLSDSAMPNNIDALYLGGGYPELHADILSSNTSMRDSIKQYSDSGMPVYAECGGFMYLTEGIFDLDDKFHPMAGVFPFKTKMRKGRSRLGYREAMLKQDSILGTEGEKVRGHEFHYSEITIQQPTAQPSNPSVVYSIKDGAGNSIEDEGYSIHNTLGSYIHVHFGSNPEIAGHLINYCKEHHGTDSLSRTR